MVLELEVVDFLADGLDLVDELVLVDLVAVEDDFLAVDLDLKEPEDEPVLVDDFVLKELLVVST